MFEPITPESHTSPPDSSEYTDTLKVYGVTFDIVWHIDVDSPEIDKIYVEDEVLELLQKGADVLIEIKSLLNKRMDEMKRETRAWKGQFNTVE